MKRLFMMVLALLVIAAMSMSALAVTMYVNSDPGKVFNHATTDSKLISRLPFGDAVDVFETDGGWSHITYVNKHGQQKTGWIKSKNLGNKAPCKHKWGDWKVVQKPTCTKEGKKEHTCVKCGVTKSKKMDKLNHSWGEWRVTKQATCVSPGMRVRKCKNCGKEQKKEYKVDHQYGAWTITREPTCTENGERVRVCSVCGNKQVQSLEKLPHDYVWNVTVEPTDHSSGVRTKICQVCGYNGGEEQFDPEGTLRRGDRNEAVYNLQQLLVDQGYLNAGAADGIFGGGTETALVKFQSDQGLNPDGIAWPQTLQYMNHDFGPWETVREMTRTEPGERKRVCRDCGKEQYETIDPGDVIERGDRGEDVRAIQQMLKEVGYDAGRFDGIYGQKMNDAFKSFDEAHGLTFTADKVRPADVDALVSAWAAASPEEMWRGESDLDSPVYMALTVTPAEDETTDAKATTYTWSLTNMGSRDCVFTALLLTYGSDPDFKSNDLVMVIDGQQLKPNSGNSVSGSFTVASNWGEGSLNFAALAVSEPTGERWLSNTVSFATEPENAPKAIAPISANIDINNLPDGVYPVAFNRGDLFNGASGVYMNAVHIYRQDVYAADDVNALAVGDTITVEGEPVPVLTLNQDEYGISVNEDQDARAFYLVPTEDNSGFVVLGMNDLSTYTDLGMTTLKVDPSATFTDAWDIENDPVTVGFEDIVATMQNSGNEYFVCYNTTVRVEAGKVVEIKRDYVP